MPFCGCCSNVRRVDHKNNYLPTGRVKDDFSPAFCSEVPFAAEDWHKCQMPIFCPLTGVSTSGVFLEYLLILIGEFGLRRTKEKRTADVLWCTLLLLLMTLLCWPLNGEAPGVQFISEYFNKCHLPFAVHSSMSLFIILMFSPWTDKHRHKAIK